MAYIFKQKREATLLTVSMLLDQGSTEGIEVDIEIFFFEFAFKLWGYCTLAGVTIY
jgi:hypothetical protein